MKAGDFDALAGEGQYDRCKVPAGYVVPDEVFDSMDILDQAFDTLSDSLNTVVDATTDTIDDTLDALNEAAEDAGETDTDIDTGDIDIDLSDLEDLFDSSLDGLADGTDVDLDDIFNDEGLNDFSENTADTLSDAADRLSDLTGFDIDIFGAEGETNWSMMYTFNAIVFAILAVQSLLLGVAVFVPTLRTCLCCLHCCCTNNVHIVMLIMALVSRYSSAGVECAKNTTRYGELSSDNFASDAATFKNLAIVGISLWFIFFCGPCCIASAQAKK